MRTETESLAWRLRTYRVPEPIIESACRAEDAGCFVSVSTIDRDHNNRLPTNRHTVVVAHGPPADVEALFRAGWSFWKHPSGRIGAEAFWEAPHVYQTLGVSNDSPSKSSNGSETPPIDSAEYPGEQGAAPPEPPRPGTAEHAEYQIARFAITSELQSGVRYALPAQVDGQRRYRPLAPASLSWSAFRQKLTEELRSLRQWSLADRIDDCGKSAYTTTCPDCGADPAKVLLFTGCDARVCVWCSRRAAQQTVRLVDTAVTIFDKALPKRADAKIAQLSAKRDRAYAQRDKAVITIASLAERCVAGDVDALLRTYSAKRREASARARARKLTARIAQLRQHSKWTWKWVTVGLGWNVFDATNYTVKGIERRFRELDRYVRRTAESLKFEGVSGLLVSFEITERGHIHAHALYRGPVRDWNWLNKSVFGDDWRQDDPHRVGTVVLGKVTDRAHEEFGTPKDSIRKAIKETVKYSFKAPTPLRVEWIAGGKARVMHPTLAARWQVAMNGRQLRRYYGGFRDAIVAAGELIHAEDKVAGEASAYCIDCGVELPPLDRPGAWNHGWTDAIAARVLQGSPDDPRDRWRRLVTIRKKPSTFAPTRINLDEVLERAFVREETSHAVAETVLSKDYDF